MPMVAKQSDSKNTGLGERIAQFRKQRGMTQLDLANQVGLSQPNISDYERNLFRPNATMLVPDFYRRPASKLRKFQVIMHG